MEYADDGDLSNKIKSRKETNDYFDEDHIVGILSQICDGMQYCHHK